MVKYFDFNGSFLNSSFGFFFPTKYCSTHKQELTWITVLKQPWLVPSEWHSMSLYYLLAWYHIKTLKFSSSFFLYHFNFDFVCINYSKKKKRRAMKIGSLALVTLSDLGNGFFFMFDSQYLKKTEVFYFSVLSPINYIWPPHFSSSSMLIM